MRPWSVFWTSVRNSPPSSEPGFYQDKDKQRKETPGRSGVFVCCHETDVLGKNPLKTHCVSPINLL